MKLMLVFALLGALGIGSFKLAQSPATAACTSSCDATVTCTPDGNCRIDCERPDGTQCWVELACDGGNCRVVDSNCSGDCSQACDAPCDSPCSTPCAMKSAAK